MIRAFQTLGFISWIIKTSMFSLLVCIVIQFSFFYDDDVILPLSVILVSWLLTLFFVSSRYRIERYPFSSFLILGYSITQFYLPVTLTLLEWKSVIYNLNRPDLVFIHSFLGLLILLLVHFVYVRLVEANPTRNILKKARRILTIISIYRAPTNKQIWIIGIIGLSGLAVKFVIGNEYASGRDDFTHKFLEGFSPFVYAPYFLLVKSLYNPYHSVKPQRRLIIELSFYTIILFVVSAAANSRGVFVTGLVSMAIAYFLGIFIGKYDYHFLYKKSTVVLGLIFLACLGPLTKFSIAMLVVREYRSDISPVQLISKTVSVYNNKHLIDNYVKYSLNVGSDWNEQYFDNIFFARFCNLKFNDISLNLASKVGHANLEMYKFSIDKLWVALPQPVLNVLNPKLDKEYIRSFSFGDYLYYLAGGENARAAYRTGHFAGTGMAAFGWYYLLLMAVGLIFLFLFIDLFVFFIQITPGGYLPGYSLAGLLYIGTFFTFFGNSSNSESIIDIYIFIVRGWIQLCLIYSLSFLLARFLWSTEK